MTSAASPAVSVLLPVRNGMPYLPAAIGSVLRQTFRDFELLVIDDGSNDGTASYLTGVTDARMRVVTAPTAGLASALTAGLAEARGRYVARQDADDWSALDRLARQVAWLDRRPDVDVLATPASFVDERDAPVESAWTQAVRARWDAAVTPDEIAALMPLTCCIFHATVMARTAILRDAGGYDQATVPAEDYDLWLRLLPAHRFARLAEPLYTVRVHAASSSAIGRATQLERVIEAKLRYLRRQVPELPWPVRLVLPGHDRGAEVFRRVGRALGFDAAMPSEGDASGVEVVAVTDFTALPAFAAAVAASGGVARYGNLFVRGPLAHGTSAPAALGDRAS